MKHRITNALEQIALGLPDSTSVEALCLARAKRALQHALEGGSNDIDPRGFYTVDKLARRWGVTDNSVRHHIDSGSLKAEKHKGRWLALGEDVALFEMRSPRKRKAPQRSAKGPGNVQDAIDMIAQDFPNINREEERND